MSGLQSMAMQLVRYASVQPVKKGFNPRPPGQIQPGSATDAVLTYLRSNPERWHTRAAVIRETGRTAKAVDWALLYLRSQSLVVCLASDARNSRYLIYRNRRVEP